MYISLHTAEPNEANLEATEVVYEGYKPMPLEGIAFAFDDTDLTNVGNVQFPKCTAHPITKQVVTHFVLTDDLLRTIAATVPLRDAYTVCKDEAPNIQPGALRLFAIRNAVRQEVQT